MKTDPTMTKVRARFAESAMSLHDLRVKMGYTTESARKSAWQFLEKTGDPRISMLRRFADAMGIKIEDLVTEKKLRERSVNCILPSAVTWFVDRFTKPGDCAWQIINAI